jgi:uncharacterized membrane protein SpoIIM required for sporulation
MIEIAAILIAAAIGVLCILAGLASFNSINWGDDDEQ